MVPPADTAAPMWPGDPPRAVRASAGGRGPLGTPARTRMRFCQQPRLEGWARRAARSSPKPRVSRGSAFGAGITVSSRQDVGLRFYADGAGATPRVYFLPDSICERGARRWPSGVRRQRSQTHPELSERPAAWLTRDSSLPHAALQGDTEGGPSLSATLWPCRQSTFAHRALTAKPRSCQQPATSAPPQVCGSRTRTIVAEDTSSSGRALEGRGPSPAEPKGPPGPIHVTPRGWSTERGVRTSVLSLLLRSETLTGPLGMQGASRPLSVRTSGLSS